MAEFFVSTPQPTKNYTIMYIKEKNTTEPNNNHVASSWRVISTDLQFKDVGIPPTLTAGWYKMHILCDLQNVNTKPSRHVIEDHTLFSMFNMGRDSIIWTSLFLKLSLYTDKHMMHELQETSGIPNNMIFPLSFYEKTKARVAGLCLIKVDYNVPQFWYSFIELNGSDLGGNYVCNVQFERLSTD